MERQGADVGSVGSDIRIMRFFRQLEVFLEECGEAFIGNGLSVLCLVAEEAHSIAEKCDLVSIREPRARDLLLIVQRAPNADHVIVRAAQVAIRVNSPTAIQDCLVFLVHLVISCCQNISLVDHHSINDDPN